MTAAVCLIGVTLAQSVQLIMNYNQKETMWKKHEKLEEGEMPTPTIIFCPEPPSRASARIISHASVNENFIETFKPPIEIFKTVLKVINCLRSRPVSPIVVVMMTESFADVLDIIYI